jgi:hypothetical protein
LEQRKKEVDDKGKAIEKTKQALEAIGTTKDEDILKEQNKKDKSISELNEKKTGLEKKMGGIDKNI